MSNKDSQYQREFEEILDSSMPLNQKRHAIGELFRKTTERLKGEGKSEAEIAELTGVDTTILRAQVVKAREVRTTTQARSVDRLKTEGKTNAEIADILGLSENTVRTILQLKKEDS